MAEGGMLPPLVLELRAKASELIAEVKTAATETEKASASMKASATEAEGAATRTGVAAEESASRAGGGWQKFMGVSKAAAVGTIAAGAVVGVESIKMASQFQSSMTLLQTAGGEQAKNMKTVSDGILSMARATGTSTEQLSEGMYTVEKAGFQGASGLKVLQAAAEGAKAENVDLGTATNALTSVMMSYHMSADKAVSVQNMLIAGSGKAKTTMQEYAGSLSTVIPIASAAGIGFDQVAGAVATLTQHGTSAQEATQELANTIRNLQAPNAVAQKAMQQLGISVNDLSAGLADPKVGLQGTILKVTGAIKDHMGPAGTVVVDAFNKSASATKDLQTMIGKMPPQLASLSKGLLDGSVTVGEYTKQAKGFGGQAGAMGGQFGALYKSADGFNQLLKSGTTDQQTAAAALKNMMGGATGLNTALMLTGESSKYFADATKEVGDAGKKTGDHIATWGQTQKTFSVQMGQLKEDVQTAAIWIGQHLLPIVSDFVGFLTSHTGVMIAFAATIGTVLVLAATAYFALMAKKTVENIADFASMIKKGALWAAENGKNFLSAIVDYARYTAAGDTALAAQMGNLKKSAVAVGAWVAEHVAGFATMVAGWATTAAAATAAFIAENLATLGIAAGIALLIAAVVWLVTHWQQAWGAIKAAASAVWDGFLKPAFEAIKNVFASIGSWFQQHAKVIVGALFFIMPPVALIIAGIHLLVTHWQQVWGAIKDATQAVVGWFEGVGHWIADVFMGGIHHAADALSTAWSATWSAIGAAAQWVYGNVIKPVGDFIVNDVIHPIVAAVQWYLGMWVAIWHAVGDAVSWVYNNVIAPVGQWIKNNVLNPIGSAVSAMGDVWSKVWGAVKTAVQDAWNFIKPIVDTIKDAIGAVGSGINAVKGFAGKVGSFLGFDNGGVVPGADGAPMLAVVHGGEVVLSRDMLAGKQAPPDELMSGVKSANGYRASSAQAALSGAAPASSSSSSSSRSGGAPSVTVNVQTNANPAQIGAALGWELRKVS